MDRERQAISSGRRKTGLSLIFLTGALLMGSGIAKFAGVAPVVAQMSANGFSGWRLTVVAFLEVASALLFVIPATRSGGLLLISAFLGGAIATHMGHGESDFGPAMVLTLVWLAAWLRHPEMLWSFGRKEESSSLSLDPQPRSGSLLRQS